jgi:integrase
MGKGQGYKYDPLGIADDEIPEGTLSYNAAVKRARHVVEQARREEQAAAAGPVLTVRDAVESYMASRDARETARKGREARSDATSRLSRYVTGKAARGKRKAVPAAPLGAVALHALTENDLLDWRAALPEALKGTTKKRLINDLKAALNTAYTNNRSRLPTTLPAAIKHGLRALDDGEEAEPIARENQILSDRQVRQVIDAARQIDEEQAWEGDLLRMVAMLAATGARFSQVARLRVGDVIAEEQRLMMPVSRKGRGGKTGSVTVRIGADILDLIRPVIGRPSTAMLLERRRKKQVAGTIRWERGERGPWLSSAELTRPWAAIRTRAGLEEDVVAYALRHSSIVRHLRHRENNPALVAKRHDTSIAMIERHYGRFIADALDELAAKSIIQLVSPAGENVVPLKRA